MLWLKNRMNGWERLPCLGRVLGLQFRVLGSSRCNMMWSESTARAPCARCAQQVVCVRVCTRSRIHLCECEGKVHVCGISGNNLLLGDHCCFGLSITYLLCSFVFSDNLFPFRLYLGTFCPLRVLPSSLLLQIPLFISVDTSTFALAHIFKIHVLASSPILLQISYSSF